MVCSRALGFVLLFLLPLALGNDIGNLKEIINKLHKISGIGNNQYAMAINVPAKYCKGGAELDQNFLSKEVEKKVKEDLNDENKIYIGTQLIAALPKEIGKTEKYAIVHHSEYRLLMNPDTTKPSHMENLLNKDNDGCTVFLTLNSPCGKFCLNPDFDRKIIPGFDLFKNHKGSKAFVFRQVWREDKKGKNKEELEKHIKNIDKIIPVYKCSENQCVRCVKNDNIFILHVNEECTT